MDLGLILGAALAGGAEGAGGAAKDSMKSMQDTIQKQDLVKMQSDLDYQKQSALQQSQQNFLQGQQQNQFGHEDTTLEKTQGFQAGQTDKEIAARATEGSADRANRLSIAEAERSTQLSIASMSNGIAQQHLNMMRNATTVITDASGKMFYSQVNPAGGTPAVTPVINPIDGSQMQGPKNVDTVTTLVAQSLMAESKANETLDPAKAADLARQARDIMTGRTKPGDIGLKIPTGPDIDTLIKNPSQHNIDLFKQHYPGVDPQMYLKPGGVGTAPATGAPAGGGVPGTPGLPGSPDTGAGTQAPPLIAGQMPSTDQNIAASNAALANRGTAKPAPAPVVPAYRPSGIIASALNSPGVQQPAPPTQQAFKTPQNALGLPQQPQANSVLNPIGLGLNQTS